LKRPAYTALDRIEFYIYLGGGTSRRMTNSVEKWTGLDQRQLALMSDEDIENRLNDAHDEWIKSFVVSGWKETK
jgi:hypothetical protein